VYLVHSFFPDHFLWILLAVTAVSFYWTAGGGRLMTVRRKIAISSWKPQKDSAMTGCVPVDMTNALKFMEEANKSGIKLTPTVLVGKAVAEALREIPEVNGRIVFGRFLPRSTIDVCFLVAVPESKNLGYATLRSVDKMSLSAIADGITKNASNVRTGKDENFKANVDLARMMPTILLNPVVQLAGFLGNVIGLTIKPLGLDAHAFGSIVVTSIGSLGIEEAYAPFTPMFHVPAVATVCAIKRKAVVVENDKIEVRSIMNITFTVDHRLLDAVEGSKFMKKLEHLLTHPTEMSLK